MERRHYIFLFLTLLLLVTSCRKITIPETTDGEGTGVTNEQPEGPIDFHGFESLDDYLTHYGSTEQPIPCADLLPGGCVYRSIMEEGALAKVQKCWVEGVIVGAVDGTTVKRTVFGTAGLIESNIVLAPTADETDYQRCLPVQLSGSTKALKEVRNALNLALNPDNLGFTVFVKGEISNYLGTIGVKNANDWYFYLGDEPDDPDPDSPSDTPVDPDDDDPVDPSISDDEDVSFNSLDEYLDVYGSEENPIPVNHLLEGKCLWTLIYAPEGRKTIPSAWVEGYIVGYISGKSMKKSIFSTDEAETNNIILAAAPGVTEYARCIPVKLYGGPAGSNDVARQLNLQEHPELYKKKVRIAGRVDEYMRVMGLMDVYQFAAF
jgi:hypothetical protein